MKIGIRKKLKYNCKIKRTYIVNRQELTCRNLTLTKLTEKYFNFGVRIQNTANDYKKR